MILIKNYQSKFVASLFVLSFLSCRNDKQIEIIDNKNFIEKVVDFQINNKSNNLIELPTLYHSLVAEIPSDDEEKLILVEVLKKRGFKVLDWGRGNYPPIGPRIISIKLKKEDCFCEVNKIYYSTVSDNLFHPTENIRCGDSLSIK